MKEGWQITSVGQLIQPIETTNPTKEPEKEFSYVDVSGVNSRSLSIEDVNTLLGKEAPSRARRRIRKDDVLFATIRPTLRRVAIVPKQLSNQVCSTGYMVLRSGNQVLPKYLFYYVTSDRFIDEMAILERGASYPAVSDADVRGAAIPLPPLDEQQAIVDILDEAFAGLEKARANAEANLESATELFQSASIEHLFSDNQSLTLVALGDVCDFKNGFAFKSNRFRRSGVPVVRIGDIQDGHINLHKAVYANQEDYSEDLGQYCIEDGDLVIAMSGATTGKIGFNRTGLSLYQNQRVGRFLAGEKLSIDYLARVLETKVKDNLAMSAGSAQPNLSTKQIKSIEIGLPTLEEQNHIVDTLNRLQLETDRLQEEYKRQLSDLDEFKQSLLQIAFAGELS